MKHNHNNVEMWNKKASILFGGFTSCLPTLPLLIFSYICIYIMFHSASTYICLCMCLCVVFVPAFVLVFEASFAAKTRTWTLPLWGGASVNACKLLPNIYLIFIQRFPTEQTEIKLCKVFAQCKFIKLHFSPQISPPKPQSCLSNPT